MSTTVRPGAKPFHDAQPLGGFEAAASLLSSTCPKRGASLAEARGCVCPCARLSEAWMPTTSLQGRIHGVSRAGTHTSAAPNQESQRTTLRAQGALLRRVDVAEGLDQPAGALVGLVLRRVVAGAFGGALRTQLGASCDRGFGFGIQGPCHAGRATAVAQAQYGHFMQFAHALDAQRFAASQCARRLGALAVDFDLAGLDRLLRQAAGLVEARRPQPEVEADGLGRCSVGNHRWDYRAQGALLRWVAETKTAALGRPLRVARCADYL